MIFKDYYKILGLDSPRVSESDIKIAFREQAKKYHPDVNIGNKNYEERFKDINEAYRILSNSGTKRKYDRQWYRNVGKNKSKNVYEKRGNAFSDFFQIFFGNAAIDPEPEENVAAKGDNVETEIKISIEDAFRGKEKSIRLRTVAGNMKTLKVEIPAGIQNNEKIRLLGQGKPGKNGGKNGDLLVRVKIKDDDVFTLKGYDLKAYLDISPWEAALGTKIVFHGINEDINVFVPSGITSGEEIIIPNKGYKDGKGDRGNLILQARIMISKHLLESEKEIYKKLAKTSDFNPRNK